MITKKKIAKRLLLTGSVLLFFFVFLKTLPAKAQTEYIFDQEVFSYSGSLTYITHTDFYSDDARIYTDTTNLYAEYILDGLVPDQTYIFYAYVRSQPSYGAMRFFVDDIYLDTLSFSALPTGWALVGTIITPSPDEDPSVMKIDRADTGSGDLVIDAVKFVATTTAQEPAPIDGWYLAGGIPEACVLGAYQPMGADDLADSYVNLNDPGVDDLMAGSAPGWNTNDGWVFGGTNYLSTSFTIDKSMSIIVRANYGVDDDNSQFVSYLFDDPIGIGLGLVDDLLFFTKGFYEHSYSDTLSIEHVSAVAYLDDGISYPFIDGIKQADNLGSDTISSPYNPIIGAVNDSGSIYDYMVGTVQAIAFYDCALTEEQVQAVSDAMIGTVTPVSTTVIYTLPTTGDAVLYQREVTAGDILIAAPIWALAILFVFREIWRTSTGGN